MAGNFCLYLLAVFLPFVSVAIKAGCGADLLINILLCVLGWLPGVIHAWYVIAKVQKEQDHKLPPQPAYPA
ncbi:hypothetical protein PRZ48_002043 [Zasmidium cellare]|uniref:Plasma membrane proteolipid 3 n=1 Tax=Zasmidium cellare TaxID=395010 RepID=A0ABR0F4T5_ZASCE|nr:hypothetical protein PRZ48_002043 [Zasmidium cellare]